MHRSDPTSRKDSLPSWEECDQLMPPDVSSFKVCLGFQAKVMLFSEWPPGSDSRLIVQGLDHFRPCRTPPTCSLCSRPRPWADKTLVRPILGSVGSTCPTRHLTLYFHWWYSQQNICRPNSISASVSQRAQPAQHLCSKYKDELYGAPLCYDADV